MWRKLISAAAVTLVAASRAATVAGECAPRPGFASAEIEGEISRGQTFRQPFGPGLVFLLEPTSHGFRIAVHDERGQDLSRFSPPLRWTNPRYVDGWHFRNQDNTGPNDGSVNQPQEIRGFIFSPEVGRTLGVAPGGPTAAEIERISETGRGELEILDYGLADLEPGQRARMVWMSFRVCLEWDATTEALGPETRDEPFRRRSSPASRAAG